MVKGIRKRPALLHFLALHCRAIPDAMSAAQGHIGR